MGKWSWRIRMYGRPKMFTPLNAKGTPVAGTSSHRRHRKHRGPWTGEETDDNRSRRENEALDYERWADDGGHHS